MTTAQIIAVVAMIVSAAVALIVAWLHRKQMRQIELFRLDPSVGLSPPSNRLTQFVKSRWDSIFAFGGPIYLLVIESVKSGPVTRGTVFIVSFSMALLVTNLFLLLLYRAQLKTSERFSQVLALQDRQITIADKMMDQVFPKT